MPQQRAARHRENVNAMATIEARGLRKTFGTTVALDGIDLHVEEGRILGMIGPNGAGKTTALNAILGPNVVRGRIESARSRSVDEPRRAHARRLVHCRCSGVAAMDSRLTVARLRRRRAPAIRSRQGGNFSGKNDDQTHEQGQGTIEGNGGAVASRDRDGNRRALARAR